MERETFDELPDLPDDLLEMSEHELGVDESEDEDDATDEGEQRRQEEEAGNGDTDQTEMSEEQAVPSIVVPNAELASAVASAPPASQITKKSESWWLAALENGSATITLSRSHEGTAAAVRSAGRAETATVERKAGAAQRSSAQQKRNPQVPKKTPRRAGAVVVLPSLERKPQPPTRKGHPFLRQQQLQLQQKHTGKLAKVTKTMSTQPILTKRNSDNKSGKKSNRKVVAKPPRSHKDMEQGRVPRWQQRELMMDRMLDDSRPRSPSLRDGSSAAARTATTLPSVGPSLGPTATGTVVPTPPSVPSGGGGGLTLPSNDDETAWTSFIETVAEQEARNADALLLQIVDRIEGRTPPKEEQEQEQEGKQDEIRDQSPAKPRLPPTGVDVHAKPLGRVARKQDHAYLRQKEAEEEHAKRRRAGDAARAAKSKLSTPPETAAAPGHGAMRLGGNSDGAPDPAALMQAKKASLSYVLKQLGAEKKRRRMLQQGGGSGNGSSSGGHQQQQQQRGQGHRKNAGSKRDLGQANRLLNRTQIVQREHGTLFYTPTDWGLRMAQHKDVCSFAVSVVQYWTQWCDKNTSLAWRRNERVGAWGRIGRGQQASQFDELAGRLHEGLRKADAVLTQPPAPDEAGSVVPPMVGLCVRVAESIIEGASSTGEVDDAMVLLQSTFVSAGSPATLGTWVSDGRRVLSWAEEELVLLLLQRQELILL